MVGSSSSSSPWVVVGFGVLVAVGGVVGLGVAVAGTVAGTIVGAVVGAAVGGTTFVGMTVAISTDGVG